MPGLIVAHSRVSDGSMLNRTNGRDEVVFQNRRTWLTSVGINPSKTYRICLSYEDNKAFCRYREVAPTDTSVAEFDATNDETDALVTTQPGTALFLPLADCIGAVLYDETHGVVMMSHLGRHSLEQNGGVRSVEHLVENYGSAPAELKVWLSAAVSKASYKIYALDYKGMKEAAFEQLEAAGVQIANINDTTDETDIHEDYYSHSQFLKGVTTENGRHAFVVMMTE